MKRAALSLTFAAALVSGVLASPPAGGTQSRYDNLDPGGQPKLVETLPVNVVFIGYDRGDVKRHEFREGLPQTYEPIVRSRAGYGIEEKLGITYNYGTTSSTPTSATWTGSSVS